MFLLRAARHLWRTPGSSLACVLILALGIGAITAILALIWSLLLRPLPYPEPDRLAAILPQVSWPDIEDIQRHAQTVSAVAGYRKRTWLYTDESHAPGEVVLSGMITHGFFTVLG